MALTFLLGNHRSGTTWLYQLLAGTGRFSVLTAHHVIGWDAWTAWWAGRGPRPDDLALAERFAALGIARRQGDDVPLTPDLPEEYGYLLQNAGLGHGFSARSLPLLHEIAGHLAQDGRPVVLKNPWDYGNFRALAAAFPDARFVFIHRHPLRVIHSTAVMFRDMWARRDAYGALISRRYVRNWDTPWRKRIFTWLAGPGLGWVVDGIGLGVAAANRHYVAHIAELPPERRLSLRYEDLCAHPEQELARILRFCGVPDAAVPVPPRPIDRGLLPEVARRQARLGRAMGPYLAALGYGADGEVGPG